MKEELSLWTLYNKINNDYISVNNNKTQVISSDGGLIIQNVDGTNVITLKNGNITANTFNGDLSGKLSIARTIDGVSFDGSSNITHYGVCSTAASTAAKTVSCMGFTLTTGAMITIYFENGHTSTTPMSLNINNTGIKECIYDDSSIEGSGIINACNVYTFVYDGTNYRLISDITSVGAKNNTIQPLYLIGVTTQGAAALSYSSSDVYIENGTLKANTIEENGELLENKYLQIANLNNLKTTVGASQFVIEQQNESGSGTYNSVNIQNNTISLNNGSGSRASLSSEILRVDTIDSYNSQVSIVSDAVYIENELYVNTIYSTNTISIGNDDYYIKIANNGIFVKSPDLEEEIDLINILKTLI